MQDVNIPHAMHITHFALTFRKFSSVELAGLELDSYNMSERLVQELDWNTEAGRRHCWSRACRR